ncbi:MAG: T9SS type A sorting domain-containing protein, partial [Bacteroidales bacterium]
PATDYFTLKLNIQSDIESISIVNILGEKVRVIHKPGTITELKIYREELPPGIYNLVIEADEIYMKRVVFK